MLLQNNKVTNIIGAMREIIGEIFKVSLITYLFFYLVDIFLPEFISHYFNVSILLWTSIISGVIMVSMHDPERDEIRPATVLTRRSVIRQLISIGILSIISGGLIYIRIREIGRLAMVIAPLTSVIIFFISYVILNEDAETVHKD